MSRQLHASNKKYLTFSIRITTLILLIVTISLAYILRPAMDHRLETATSPQPYETMLALKHPSAETSSSIVDQSVPTTGCGDPLTLKRGVSNGVLMTSADQLRNYFVYIPSSYNNSIPHAVVMDFHGYGANAHIQEATSQFDPVANSNDFIVVYPDGSVGTTGKQGWDTGLHPGIKANDTLFVSNMLNQLQSNLCVQPTQIYATGLSNGGGFVNLLACDMSDRIAAFAPVSGSYVTPPQDCHVKRPVSILEFHGTADTVNPYNGDPAKREPPVTKWLDGWVNTDGCSTVPTTAPVNSQTTAYTWSGCDNQASIIHYKIAGGQHVWPDELFNQVTDGQTKTVNAATVIWHFFATHSLTPVTASLNVRKT
jgi:polyhydroxybutyrate depolymerase